MLQTAISGHAQLTCAQRLAFRAWASSNFISPVRLKAPGFFFWAGAASVLMSFSLHSNFVSSCFFSKIWAESALSLGSLSSPLVAEQVSPRRGRMFIVLGQANTPGAVRRSGTQVDKYSSRQRSAPSNGAGFFAMSKSINMPLLRSEDH